MSRGKQSFEHFTWTVHVNPNTGKTYLGVSTPPENLVTVSPATPSLAEPLASPVSASEKKSASLSFRLGLSRSSSASSGLASPPSPSGKKPSLKKDSESRKESADDLNTPSIAVGKKLSLKEAETVSRKDSEYGLSSPPIAGKKLSLKEAETTPRKDSESGQSSTRPLAGKKLSLENGVPVRKESESGSFAGKKLSVEIGVSTRKESESSSMSPRAGKQHSLEVGVSTTRKESETGNIIAGKQLSLEIGLSTRKESESSSSSPRGGGGGKKLSLENGVNARKDSESGISPRGAGKKLSLDVIARKDSDYTQSSPRLAASGKSVSLEAEAGLNVPSIVVGKKLSLKEAEHVSSRKDSEYMDTSKKDSEYGLSSPPVAGKRLSLKEADTSKKESEYGLSSPPITGKKLSLKEADTSKKDSEYGLSSPPIAGKKLSLKEADTSKRDSEYGLITHPAAGKKLSPENGVISRKESEYGLSAPPVAGGKKFSLKESEGLASPSPLVKKSSLEDDDDYEEDVVLCEVCGHDERHQATHWCPDCRHDMCASKAGAHKTEFPTHALLCLEESKAQELVRFGALFGLPDFQMTKFYVEVLWDDPEPQQDGELAMRKYDILEVIPDRNENDEWWYGTKIDRTGAGLFPCNYVRKLELKKIARNLALTRSPPLPAAPTPSSSSMRMKKLSLAFISRPKPATKMDDKKQSGGSTKCMVAVVSTQEFRDSSVLGGAYLSFIKGEKLTVTNKKTDRWWWGHNARGNKGWIPASFVQQE